MSFLLFLRGLIGVLIVFALASYAITQSLWTTLISTAICAVLIQLGYFVVILFIVWRAGPPEKQADAASTRERMPAAAKEAESVPLPGIRRSHLP